MKYIQHRKFWNLNAPKFQKIMEIPSALYRGRKGQSFSCPSQVLRHPVTQDRPLHTKPHIFIWSQFYMTQKPSDRRPKDPGWTIHFMFWVNGPWMTVQKQHCTDRQWSAHLDGKQRGQSKVLLAPALLHSSFLGLGGSPLETGSVCVGFMADFGKTQFWFLWPVSGKGKVSFNGLSGQDKGWETRRSERNIVPEAFTLGCNSQIFTTRKLGGHRWTGAFWPLRMMQPDASRENHSWRHPHLGLSENPCISPGP